MTCNHVAGREPKESGKEIQNARERISGSGQHHKEKKKNQRKRKRKVHIFLTTLESGISGMERFIISLRS